MNGTKCVNGDCRDTVLAGDRFCGTCGTPVPEQAPLSAPNFSPANGATRHGATPGGAKTRPAATRGAAEPPPADPVREPVGAPFFSHERPQRPGPLSNATRFLCAAAYLDYGFASKVIWNLMVTRRAVAPSINFDVGPVLRHCLRARRDILIRDTVLVLIVAIGLVGKTLPTLDVLLCTFVLGGALPRVGHRRGGLRARLALLLGTVVAGGLAVLLTVSLVVGSVASSVFSGGGLSAGSAEAALGHLVGLFAVLLGALSATEFVYLRTTARALAGDSRPGTGSRQALSRSAQQRMAIVEAAQWGNVTLHSGWRPFIGAGEQTEAHWSIATPLLARKGGDQDGRELPSAGRHVPIDPVDLHRFMGERLRALNDPALPENERIAALRVSDRLVGTGWMSGDNPLFDRTLNTPYSHASREAIEALIRHPQARLRYYQQVSVNDESPTVMSHGRKVIGDLDQEVAVSAFVYAAIEGRMLYLQFVQTALTPIDALYKVNRLGYAISAPRTLIYAFKRLFSSIISAVPGLYGAFRLWRHERQWENTYLSAVGGDYGADISVRELGTADEFGRYMQVLDVEKYNMIISQVLLNSATEFLAENGIDVTAFTGAAQNIINNINNNNGSVYGDLKQQAGNNRMNGQPKPNPGPGGNN